MRPKSFFRHTLHLCLLAWLVAACATAPSATPSPASAPSPSPTSRAVTLQPTITEAAPPSAFTPTTVVLEPTATTLPPTLTPTAFLPLSTHGPYLVYAKSYSDQWGELTTGPFVIMDADGTGREIISLPEGGYVHDLQAAFSPDGKWLAFYTGTAGDWQDAANAGPFDLSLHLMRLADGQVSLVTRLLSEDYPDNFRKAAELLSGQYSDISPSDLPIALRQAFLDGILSLAWSPDGHNLAFAGEMDGPSSDLYVYDPETQSIRRLTDGLQQIQWLEWSPDAKWIIHGSQNIVGEGSFPDFYAAAADGSSVKDLKFWGVGGGWADQTHYLAFSAANGPGTFGLQSLDVENDRGVDLWPDRFLSFAIDLEKGVVAVSATGSYRPDVEVRPGIYFVDLLSGNRRLVLPDTVWDIRFWGAPINRFVATNYSEEGTVALALDGSVIQLNDKSLRAVPSPDQQWLALYGGLSDSGLELRASDGSLVRQATDSKIRNVMWRPDSRGLFFTSSTDLYYVTIPDGDPVLVDQGLPEDRYSFAFTWIKGR